ncbi:MAG TPA: Nif3-like dinuclear metal center hexameric protein [Chitinolyticbacter sp.]|nr:Nif3-like dinuclear metal center hexameric protein [Chitinolyticbacter sp.]
MAVPRAQLIDYIGQLLEPERWRDYCPNGLQVEGRAQVSKLATSVTASLDAIDAAIAAGADTLLVHHGYFWKGEAAPVVGTKRQRIARLLAHDINLLAYHLPLDAHPTLGNNAELARVLGLVATARCGEQDMVWLGEAPGAPLLASLGERISGALGREPLVIGDADKPVRRVAWCTGGAQSYFHELAARGGIDCYITGEASEFVTHLARESGIAFIAAGHHATERYGVRALGEHLASQLALKVVHLECENPV